MVVNKPQPRARVAGNSLQRTPASKLSHNEQASRLGLECCKEVKWLGWRPGQEYIRSCTIKNVSSDVLHLSWALPTSKLFALEYPEPIDLSPGISYTLKVTFRPVRQEPLEDQVKFVCQRGGFAVPLRVCLPAVKLEVPKFVDMGLTPVRGEGSHALRVTNTGDAAVNCSWEIGQPFSVIPNTASIDANQSFTFDCHFQPPEASVYTVLAACHADTGYTATVKVSGIGKYPFLALEHSDLQFGNVLVGEQVEQSVQLVNQGLVPAEFIVTQDQPATGSFIDNSIKISPSRGRLEAVSATALRATYTPTASGVFACEHFTVQAAGGQQVHFSVSGVAVAPSVQLSTSCLSFGSLQAHGILAKAVYIHNKAELPIYFEFVTDPRGVFAFDRVRGSVAGMSSVHVTVTFQPKEASNFWRRITCLVRDGSALTIDLLGSCFTDLLRPPALTPQHISQYLHQGPASVDLRTVGDSPDMTQMQEPSATALNAEASMTSTSMATADLVQGGNGAEMKAAGQEGWEVFFKGSGPQQMVIVSDLEIDFGSCSRLSTGSHKTLTVTNNTTAKVTAFLAVPDWQGYGSQPHAHQVFQVFPEQLDIRANSNGTFRVAFRPPLDGQYFSQTLEVVACLKAHRSFRGVSEGVVFPPWTIPVQVVGNTFLHQHEQPDTKVALSSATLSLAACLPGQATYQTVMLMNPGDTAVQFDVQGLLHSPGFSCKPERGVVGPQSWQLLGLCFQSDQKGPHTARLSCVINSSQASAQPLVVQATVATPTVQMEPAGRLFFKPTCIGAASQRTLTLHNTSRVPLVFQWTVPEHVRGSFHVQPQSALLHGNQRQPVTWTFAPSDKATYDASMTCAYGSPHHADLGPAAAIARLGQLETGPGGQSAVGGLAGLSQQIGVRLVGQGTIGALTLEPTCIDFGTVAVGFSAVRDITLLNQSGGNLCYKVSCIATAAQAAAEMPSAADSASNAQQTSDVELLQGRSELHDDDSAMHLVIEEPSGSLPARATKTLRLTLNPVCRKQYNLQLVCHTATAGVPGGATQSTALSTVALPASMSSPPVCAAVAAFSTYPTVMITDIACQGLDKPFVWNQMRCSQINTELAAEMTEPELVLDAKKLNGGYTTRSALEMLPPFHMDMGVGGIDSCPRVVVVRLTNPGSLPVEWDLQRVGDMGVGVEPENWVEPSRPRSDREKLHDFIVQEGLLQLQPPVGSLAPGQSTTWTITYKHSALGSHDLSILLAIKDSKQLHLHLTGVTVPSDHLCLSMMDQPFQLAPVPIGERCPPRQTYCLRNGGPAELPYSIDTAPLQQLIKSNYGYEVLKLLDLPKGTIAPDSTEGLNFVFSPLEAREYDITLPIKLGNGAKTALHVIGKGYHPLPAGAESLSDESALVAAESTSRHQKVAWASQIDAAADKATWPGFSAASLVQLPQQLLSLSHGLVSFGPVSIQGISKRVVALTAGTDFGIDFEWSLELCAWEKRLLDGSLQIEPLNGRLAPNDRCLCRLTFTAGLNPQLFEAAIKCRITPIAEPLSPLQPTRVPSINSPLGSPRTAVRTASHAESAQAVAGTHSTTQHGHRSPRMAISPRKGSRADLGPAGAPLRQGSTGSPSKDKGQSSPSRARASQNRAPLSRASSSSSSIGGQKGMSAQKSPIKASLRNDKAASPAKAGGKAGSATLTGRAGSTVGNGPKPTARSPHKARREPDASRVPVVEVVDEVIAEHPAPPLSPFSPGSKLAARGPVHTALTASIRSHFATSPTSKQAAEGLPGGHSDVESPPMPQTLVLNVEGRVLTPDQMRAGMFVLPSEAALASSLLQGGGWQTPRIPIPSTSEQSLAPDNLQEASAVLQDILAELVNSSDVSAALDSLLEEETPTLAEVRHGQKLSQAALPLPATHDGDVDHNKVVDTQPSSTRQDGSDSSSAQAAAGKQQSVGQEVMQHDRDSEGRDNGGFVDRMLQQPDFQVFAEFVLDSACLSILQESAAGNWQPPSEGSQ